MIGYDEKREKARARRAEKHAKQAKRGVVKINATRNGTRWGGAVVPELRKFVQGLPCLIDGHGSTCWYPDGKSDAAHVTPKDRRITDYDSLIPLCRKHHREQEGQSARFVAVYGLKPLRKVAEQVTARFLREHNRHSVRNASLSSPVGTRGRG